MKNTLFITVFVFHLLPCLSHDVSIQILQEITLPKDTVERKILLESLDAFLRASQKYNEMNNFVLESEKSETFILLDELKGIGYNAATKDSTFYKPYLDNVALLNDSVYHLQISYRSVQNNSPLLRAIFYFLAYRKNKKIFFSSPLKRNTLLWKKSSINGCTFYYEHTLDIKKVKKFTRTSSSFDKIITGRTPLHTYYCSQNLIDLQKMVGIVYISDYNGKSKGVLASSYKGNYVFMLGNNNSTIYEFDSHDLFHSRLYITIPRHTINKSIDEGCAYLHGGSWGISWKEIFRTFYHDIANDTTIDWQNMKENPLYFSTKKFKNSSDYIISALLVKKIKKEHGFQAVHTLLTIGNNDKDNRKYYDVLKELTGITKEDYNEKVRGLIRQEKEELHIQ